MSTFAKIIFSERISNPTTNGRVGLDIHNPFIGLFLPFIPSAASFGVSVIVYIDEKVEKLNVDIVIKHKKSEEVIFKSENAEVHIPIVGPSDTMININLNLDLRNVSVKHEGEYIAICKINGEQFTESFFIYKQLGNV